MIHLFNNVSVEHVSKINYLNQNIKIFSQDFNDIQHTVEGAADIDEVDFSELLSENARVFIYCDLHNMTKLLAKFYKSTTSVSKGMFMEIVSCYHHKMASVGEEVEGFLESCESFWGEVASVPVPEVEQNFELSLARAFNTEEVDEAFKATLSKFILRQHENIVLEGKKIVDKYVMTLPIQKLLGNTKSKPVNPSKLGGLDWGIYQGEYWNQPNGLVNVYTAGEESVDLTKATPEEIKAITEFTDKVFGLSEEGVPSPSNGWEFIAEVVSAEGLSEESYFSVLDSILNSSVAVPYVPEDIFESLNFELLCYIRNLKKSNSTLLSKLG